MAQKTVPVLIVGGGIGGLGAALALALQGIPSRVLEQASGFGEIGAGIQLGPNVFRMFHRLGISDAIEKRAVFVDKIIMMDAVAGTPITEVPLGKPFRERFGQPYAVIHRADLHRALLDACEARGELISLETKTSVTSVRDTDDGVVAASRDRYRTDDQAHNPVQRTFDEAIRRNQNDSWLVELADGNHFTICDPIDETSGRSFLEAELRSTDSAARDTLALVLLAFLSEHCRELGEQDRVEDLVGARTISRWARR